MLFGKGGTPALFFTLQKLLPNNAVPLGRQHFGSPNITQVKLFEQGTGIRCPHLAIANGIAGSTCAIQHFHGVVLIHTDKMGPKLQTQ